MRASGFAAARRGGVGARQHQRRRAVVDRRRVARRDRAVLLERRPQRAAACRRRRARAPRRRRRRAAAPLRCAISTGTISPLELALGLRAQRAPVRLGGERVLVGARDPLLLGAQLGAVAHVDVAVRVPQPVVDQRVDHLRVPQPVPVARLGQQVGRVASSTPCRPRRRRRARRSRSRCAPNTTAFRPEPQTLLTVTAPTAVGHAGADRRLARGRLPDARPAARSPCRPRRCRARVAGDAGARERLLDGDGAQLRGRQRRQRALKRSDRACARQRR